ncbi:TetR/AcrR family transcriptional regulator [Pikeienuella sp. HZG-20]|uniref:TetR/AcrR family transcriptional regulator n=1 Tax=Paludibacillus litoralis TaxID=3133267 RepID=UPI0030EE8E9D
MSNVKPAPDAGKDRLAFERPARKLTRDQKARKIYRNLLEAGARVVGEHGYAGTSVARLTEEAGVAQGTFYNYFKDRQGLFDILLPYVGQQMTDRITRDLKATQATGLEREAVRIRSYCSYLKDNPGFYRILYEAEVFAPVAHAEHIRRLTDGYCRALRRGMKAGHVRRMPDDELKAIVAILLGARAYISMQYKTDSVIPESAIQAYLGLMKDGLFR